MTDDNRCPECLRGFPLISEEGMAVLLTAKCQPLVEAMGHALEAINSALDHTSFGDTCESDLLEAHATLDSALAEAVR